MSFLAPGFLWLLAAVPLVVALHFLRNRRRHQLVSAVFLWQVAREQATEQKRFALWWLLLLQILAIVLLAAALAQPVLLGRGVPDRVLVVDASASMAARDPDGVRLVKALSRAGELIGQGGRVALIRAGSDATVLAPLTASQNELSVALAGLVAADASADLDRALDLAAAISDEAEIHLFTDQPPPPRVGYEWHGVAGGGFNLGISTLDLGPGQAFVAVTSTWPRPQLVNVYLEQDGRPAGSAEVLVPASGQGNVTFPLFDLSGVFRASIEPPADDALQLDDEAWAGSRQLSYFTLDESAPLERALAAVPGLQRAPNAAAADVLVARSGSVIPGLPAANLLLFEPRSNQAEYVLVRDWDQSDPLLRFVDLQGSQVGLDSGWQPPEPEGTRVLARGSDLRPIMTTGVQDGRRVLHLGFDPAQSDLIYRPAFPTLIANAIRWFRGESSLRLGDRLPEGSTFGGEPVTFATQPGSYQTPAGQVTASLLSATESRLPGPSAGAETQTGTVGSALPVAAAAGDSNLAPWLLLLLPVLLAVEWLLWSRRSGRLTQRLIKSGQ